MEGNSAQNFFARDVLMIRPREFRLNRETAKTNRFQKSDQSGDSTKHAQTEFDGLVASLEDFGVGVHVFQSDASKDCPDSVFPNNWISTHPSGDLFLYPMEAESRRRERREDIVQFLQKNFGPYELKDFSSLEKKSQYLEGTGCLVLDNRNKHAFAALSSRCSSELLKLFSDASGYEVFSFQSLDPEGYPIYHTNVMMALGLKTALLCSDSIPDKEERVHLTEKIERSGKEIVYFSMKQLYEFCGNAILLRNQHGETAWFLSQRALDALSESQIEKLQKDGPLRASDVSTIEKLGGGSVRCMIAEIFPAHSRSI